MTLINPESLLQEAIDAGKISLEAIRWDGWSVADIS